MSSPYLMVMVCLILFVLLTISIGIYKYIFPKKKINLFFVIFLFSILPILSLLRPGMPDSADIPLHAFFTMNFFDSLMQGHLFPQWAYLAANGYGEPFFIFMYQAPYYLGSLFHLMGFNFIDSTKLVFIASYILSFITMYLWTKDEFGETPGFVATVFYQFAPYHLIMMHFYTSYGETMAFAVLPLSFLSIRRFIFTKKYIWFALLAFSYALTVLTHLTMALVILPFLFIYAFLLCRKERRLWKTLILTYAALFAGICLSAYYWVQTIVEAKLVMQINALRVLTEHFLDFFYSPWGLGFLFQGKYGQVKFLVGYAQWIMFFLILFLLAKKLIQKSDKTFTYFYLISFILLFILMQDFSKNIWTLPLLNNFRSTNRLLLFEAFFTSALAAIVVRNFKNLVRNKLKVNYFVVIICLFAMASTIPNWGNRKIIPINNPNLESTIQSFKITEYSLLPIWVKKTNTIGNNLNYSYVSVIKGDASVSTVSKTINNHIYKIYAKSNSVIRENTFYFPGWIIKVNGKNVPINFTDKNNSGIMLFNVSRGISNVDVNFTDTPTRRFSEIISLLSLIILLIAPLLLKSVKKAKFSSKPR